MDPLTDAGALVADRFPDATWAILTGSVLGPHRTAGLWIDTARTALAISGRWVSGGKWLLRELRELDPSFATGWLAARDDPAPPAEQVLARAGGPLFEGYRA
jgi:hypothetical protein